MGSVLTTTHGGKKATALLTPYEAQQYRLRREERHAKLMEGIMSRKIDKELVRIRAAMEEGLNRIPATVGETHESWRLICERLIPSLVEKGYVAKVIATEVVPGNYDPAIPSTYKLWLSWKEAPEPLPPYNCTIEARNGK